VCVSGSVVSGPTGRACMETTVYSRTCRNK